MLKCFTKKKFQFALVKKKIKFYFYNFIPPRSPTKKTRNLTKDLKDLQTKNYKTMIKETERIQVKR